MLKQKGFSVTEVMITTAVFCVMSIFAYPAVLDLRQSIQVYSVVSDIMGDVQYAKFQAIKENNYVVIQFTDHGYKIFVDNGEGAGISGDWENHEEEELLIERSFGENINLSSNFPSDHLRFSGIIGIKPGTIFIEVDKVKQYEIVLSRLGRVRLVKN